MPKAQTHCLRVFGSLLMGAGGQGIGIGRKTLYAAAGEAHAGQTYVGIAGAEQNLPKPVRHSVRASLLGFGDIAHCRLKLQTHLLTYLRALFDHTNRQVFLALLTQLQSRHQVWQRISSGTICETAKNAHANNAAALHCCFMLLLCAVRCCCRDSQGSCQDCLLAQQLLETTTRHDTGITLASPCCRAAAGCSRLL